MWSLFQVVVQYDKDLLEVWDEAKRLRCEWFNDYEKTASKPPMVIADLDVIQLDFRGELTTICLFWLGMSSRLPDIHLLLYSTLCSIQKMEIDNKMSAVCCMYCKIIKLFWSDAAS